MANPLLHNGLPPFTLHANAVFSGNGSNDRLPLPNFRSDYGRSRFWIIEVSLIVAGSLAFCSAVPPAAGAGLGRSIDMIFASLAFLKAFRPALRQQIRARYVAPVKVRFGSVSTSELRTKRDAPGPRRAVLHTSSNPI